MAPARPTPQSTSTAHRPAGPPALVQVYPVEGLLELTPPLPAATSPGPSASPPWIPELISLRAALPLFLSSRVLGPPPSTLLIPCLHGPCPQWYIPGIAPPNTKIITLLGCKVVGHA